MGGWGPGDKMCPQPRPELVGAANVITVMAAEPDRDVVGATEVLEKYLHSPGEI